MSQKFKNIDKFFLNNLDKLEDQPSLYVWEDIENALDNSPTPPVNSHRQTGKDYRLLILLVLLIAGIGIWIDKSGKVEPRNITATITISHQAAKPVMEIATRSGSKLKEGIKPKTEWADLNEPIAAKMAVSKEETGTEVQKTDYRADNNYASQKQTAETTIPFSDEPYNTLSILSVPKKMPTQPYITVVIPTIKPVNNIKKSPVSRLSMAVFFAPDLTTRILEQDRGRTNDAKKDAISRTERNSALDFTLGTRIDYSLSKHFSLQSGISFSSNTIDISPKTIYARYDTDGTVKYQYNCSSGYAYFKPKTAALTAGDSTQALASTSVLHYVNIPIAIKYNYTFRRLNLFAQAGITARFITKKSIAAVYAFGGTDQHTTNQIQGLKTSYFNGVIGVGADYSIGRRLAITLFPSFNFATSSINQNAPVKAYPNTFSIASGIKVFF